MRSLAEHDDQETGGLAYGLADLFTLFRQRAGTIIAITVGITGLAVAFAMSLPSQYEASATILIDSREKKVVDIDAVLSDLRTDTPTIESEVEILRSRALAGRVINALRLDQDPEFNGALANMDADTDTSSVAQSLGVTSPSGAQIRERLLASTAETAAFSDDVFAEFLSRVDTYRIRNTFLIGVSFRSRSPEKSARIVNALADAYLSDQVETKSQAAEVATVWLERRIEDLRKDVFANERRIERYKSDNNMVSSEGHPLDEKQLARLMEQLILARAATATANARYEQVSGLLGDANQEQTIADVLQSNTVAKLKEEHARSTRRVAELRTRYGARHPAIREAEAEAADAYAQLQAEIQSIVTNLKNEREVTRSQEIALGASLEDLKSHTSVSNEENVALRSLEREVEASRLVYEAFLKRYRETAEQRSFQLPDARIVQRASVPDFPSSPKRKQIAIGGLAVGFFLALMTAVALELRSPRILTPRIVEARFGTRHLASLPQLASDGGGDDPMRLARLILADPNGQFADAVRSARLAIDHWRVDDSARVIVVTAPGGDMARTEFSSNLAHQYALSGVRALLIDGDARRASLTRTFCSLETPGLIDHVVQDMPVEDLIVTDRCCGLSFMPVGGSAMRGAIAGDAFVSVQIVHAMARLRELFDVIVIDAPGLGAGAIAGALVAHGDQIALVYDWSANEAGAAKAAVRELSIYGDRLCGMITSEVQPKAPSPKRLRLMPFASDNLIANRA